MNNSTDMPDYWDEGDARVSDGAPFRYIDRKDYDMVLSDDNLPHVLSIGGVFICLEGQGDVIINEHKYHLTPNTMCVAFPGTIIQSFDADEAFRGYTLAIDIDFIREINIPSANSIYIVMRDNPCMVLSDEQLEAVMRVCRMMHEKNLRSDHPFHKQINAQMLMLLCYELAGIYARYVPVERQPCTRQDVLFRKFLSLLATDITLSREVQYYADKLCITPKYLTIITRQISGRNATSWITHAVILNAKSLLTGTRLTVQQISNRLNFPNPSFFGQYFLRYTGMTPREFRLSKQ